MLLTEWTAAGCALMRKWFVGNNSAIKQRVALNTRKWFVGNNSVIKQRVALNLLRE